MIDRLKKLSDQLDVIAEVLAIACEEADAEQRQHLLAVVGRAHNASRLDLQTAIDEETSRPKLRLIVGGLGATLPPISVLAATLGRARRHPVTVAAASTTAAALAIAGLLVLGMDDRHEYADRAPIGPVSTSTRSATGPAVEAPPMATSGTSAPAPAPGNSAVDVAYSSPVDRPPSASGVTPTPHTPAPSSAGTTTPAPPSTVRPPTSPTWTPSPTASPTVPPPDNQAGCLRLVLLNLADADVCLLAAG